MKRPWSWLVLIPLAFGVVVSPVLAKQRAKIGKLMLLVDRERVGVNLSVENCFSPKAEKMIQSGVPATLTFFIKLHRSRPLWKDQKLAFLKLTRRIQYDTIKKEYEVFMHETSAPVLFKDFETAKKKLAHLEDIWVTPLQPLSPEATYYLSVRAELEPMGLPFRLKDLLFFVPSSKMKTDWVVQRFRIGSFVMPRQRGTRP